jgi:hypothetical protein
MAKKIDEPKAEKWVKKFKDKKTGVITSANIPRSVIENLLQQSNCEGIRVYNAFNESDSDGGKGYTMIVLGTYANGENQLPSDNSTYSIWDDNNVCPPNCPSNDLAKE